MIIIIGDRKMRGRLTTGLLSTHISTKTSSNLSIRSGLTWANSDTSWTDAIAH